MDKFLESCRLDDFQLDNSHPEDTLRTSHSDLEGSDSDSPPRFTLLRNIRARARAASQIWAEDNHELVEYHRAGKSIGARNRLVRQMFDALPKEEQEEYENKAAEEKVTMNTHPDQCFA